jgi:hypothetical protein
LTFRPGFATFKAGSLTIELNVFGREGTKMNEYVLYLKLAKKGNYKSFEKAFTRFYRAIKEQIEAGEGGVVLMTTNFVVYDYTDIHAGTFGEESMAWERAREFAFKMGYLSKDGELTKPEKKVPEDEVIRQFIDFKWGKPKPDFRKNYFRRRI